MTARLTRQERKADTRRRLLDAAARVFARKGYLASSMEEVAETAGFSTGALYSNFSGKEDLFLALYEERIDAVGRMVAEMMSAAASTEEGIAAVGTWSTRTGTDERGMALLHREFLVVAMRNRQLRARLAALYREPRRQLGRLIEKQCRDLGLELPVAPEAAAEVVLALASGLTEHRLVDPDAVGRELFPRALNLMLAGLEARQPARRQR